jgi:hypothetical protein
MSGSIFGWRSLAHRKWRKRHNENLEPRVGLLIGLGMSEKNPGFRHQFYDELFENKRIK